MSKREIDYLSEDAPIHGQKYALISIVGPHLNQKCDVWGLKIKGVTETLDAAKNMCKKLIKNDPEFDIFTVEVGKFFPLAVEPTQVSDIEYQNEQLNKMMKSYLENRQLANEQWLERKQKMMEDAIREGRTREQADAPEHAVAILQRIQTFQDRISQLTTELSAITSDMTLAQEKFESCPESERQQAETLMKGATKGPQGPQGPDGTEAGSTIATLQELDSSISELKQRMNGVNRDHSPSVYLTLEQQLQDLSVQRDTLKSKLTDKTVVNAFFNENFNGSNAYEELGAPVKTV
jgi:uncharacterized protein YukE